jgi:hypothetical protein
MVGTMTAGPHPDLDSRHRWVPEAGRLLADLGFTLINGDDPDAMGRANLLIALRQTPTLEHFDAEAVTYWRFEQDHGELATLDRDTPDPAAERPYSWGRIRVSDRHQVENDYLSFGGIIRVADQDRTTRVIQFHSWAPILRWDGHSQGVDALTDEVGAFFGRLMAPIDFQPGAEALVGVADPLSLYAAFVQDAWRRFAATLQEVEAEPEMAAWARREGHRLEREHPDAVSHGRALRIALGMRPPL